MTGAVIVVDWLHSLLANSAKPASCSACLQDNIDNPAKCDVLTASNKNQEKMRSFTHASPAFGAVQLAPLRTLRVSRSVQAKFRKELHPSYYETVQSAMKMFEDSVHNPEILKTGLSDDFMCTGTEHQNIHSIDKDTYISMVMERQKEGPAIVSAQTAAFAVCPYDTSVMQMAPESEEDLASGFALMELLEDGAQEGAKVVQGFGRIIVNRDGQARVWERFRPLMGQEPDMLLQDPEGYRQRMAHDVPRLDVKPVKGDQEKMMEIVTIIARDLFNTGEYNGDSLQFLADDVVLYDAMGDNPTCPVTGGPTIYRGKAEVDKLARFYHTLMGQQQMLAAAASEDSNTAFAHFASLVMGGSSMGWRNAAHRMMLCVTFDDACEKVTAIASARTFMAYERDTCFKPAVEWPPHKGSA